MLTGQYVDPPLGTVDASGAAPGSGTAPPESPHLTIAISPSSGHGTSRRLRLPRGPKRQRLPVEIRGSSLGGRFSRRGLRQPGPSGAC